MEGGLTASPVSMPENSQDDRPPVYREGDTWIFRLSGIGVLCETHLAAVALGQIPPRESIPENVRKAWKDGHHYERLVKFRLRDEFGWIIDQEQVELELPVGTRAKIRGHWDGRNQIPVGSGGIIPWSLLQQGYDGRKAVLEVKSGADSSYAKFCMSGLEAFPGYAVQVSIEAMITGLPIVVVFQGKGNLDDLAFRYYPGPIVSAMDSVKKILAVLAAIDAGSVPMCHGRSAFGNCPFPQYHNPDTKEVVKVDDPAVEKAILAYREIGERIKSLEEERSTHRVIVESAMAAVGDRKIKAGVGSAQWIETDRLDTRGLGEDHPDLIKRYRSGSRWLRIDGPRSKGAAQS